MHAPSLLVASPTPLAEWELQLKIQQALNNRLTGQIQVTFLNGRTETIFARNGKVQNLYIRNHRLPNIDWDSPIGRFGRGTLSIDHVPARALMFKKVMLEEISAPRPQPSGTNQLKTMFSLAEHNLNPTLFHIRWQRAEGFVLVAGSHIPIRHAVLVTRAGTQEGKTALEQIPLWEEANCSVIVHHGDIKNQAWLELHLNILFEWYARNIFDHYKHITGIVMVRSILQNLAVMAEAKGWNISTRDQQLRDMSFFPSAADAADAYRAMLSAIRARIDPIIGHPLAHNLFKQSMAPTQGMYKLIQEIFGLIEDET
jgi:hypothetical protein